MKKHVFSVYGLDDERANIHILKLFCCEAANGNEEINLGGMTMVMFC